MTLRTFLDQEITRAGGPEYLADLVGVATTSIYRWRLGTILPGAEHIAMLAKVTGSLESQVALLVHASRKTRAIARRPLAKAPVVAVAAPQRILSTHPAA